MRGVVPVNLRRPEAAGRLGTGSASSSWRSRSGSRTRSTGSSRSGAGCARSRTRPRRSPSTRCSGPWGWRPGRSSTWRCDLRVQGDRGGDQRDWAEQEIAIAGAPLREAMFWVPSAGRLALGVSLLSYAGKVWLGLQCDAGESFPDPAGGPGRTSGPRWRPSSSCAGWRASRGREGAGKNRPVPARQERSSGGDPTRIRTAVTALKGPSPGPLDDGVGARKLAEVPSLGQVASRDDPEAFPDRAPPEPGGGRRGAPGGRGPALRRWPA